MVPGPSSIYPGNPLVHQAVRGRLGPWNTAMAFPRGNGGSPRCKELKARDLECKIVHKREWMHRQMRLLPCPHTCNLHIEISPHVRLPRTEAAKSCIAANSIQEPHHPFSRHRLRGGEVSTGQGSLSRGDCFLSAKGSTITVTCSHTANSKI